MPRPRSSDDDGKRGERDRGLVAYVCSLGAVVLLAVIHLVDKWKRGAQ